MKDPVRLVVVHPFNPPHVIPLIEVVPSATTSKELVEAAVRYFEGVGHWPVVVRRETKGFVANRLAFSVLREVSFSTGGRREH
jgi:3-hydroxyacyl-CoA dehydrogenase